MAAIRSLRLPDSALRASPLRQTLNGLAAYCRNFDVMLSWLKLEVPNDDWLSLIIERNVRMEYMVDKDLIKKLRIERSWSQDQLASVSGLSLRTIQRIENEGTCSLESKKALAVAFEITANELDLNTTAINTLASVNRGRKFGFSGAIAGLVFAYIGITTSFMSGHITSGEAGLYYGGVGAFCGVCCAIIGTLSNKYRAGAV